VHPDNNQLESLPGLVDTDEYAIRAHGADVHDTLSWSSSKFDLLVLHWRWQVAE
jgi:hypothetical protein